MKGNIEISELKMSLTPQGREKACAIKGSVMAQLH